MKKLNFLILTTMLFSSLSLVAQSENKLDLQEDGTFQIPPTELKEAYNLDIASLNFESFEAALEYLTQKNTDLIMFRPNRDGTEATVFLQLGKKPQWTVNQWNNAISEITLP